VSTLSARATLDDLYRVEGKAELIGGKVVPLSPRGYRPGEIAGNVYSSLREFARASKGGIATGGAVGFAIAELRSGRESFCPDVAYFDGPLPANLMRFIEGPPTFAVEVRSENDYGPAAELEMAAKRDDYFEAGTLAVWDVDPVSEQIGLYTVEKPDRPIVFRRGQTANAGTAIPCWTVAVDDVFATDL
jgi:Uma2 family endonuclease